MAADAEASDYQSTRCGLLHRQKTIAICCEWSQPEPRLKQIQLTLASPAYAPARHSPDHFQ